MTTWAPVAGMFAMGTIAAIYGTLMLISPRKWVRLVDKASFAEKWSDSDPTDTGGRVQTRIAGLVISGVGVYFALTALRGLLGSHVSPYAAVQSQTQSIPARSWFNLLAPGLAGVGGIVVLVFPERFLLWSAARMRPPREIKTAALPLLELFVRTMGGLMILGAAWSIYNWFGAA